MKNMDIFIDIEGCRTVSKLLAFQKILEFPQDFLDSSNVGHQQNRGFPPVNKDGNGKCAIYSKIYRWISH